MKTPTSRLISTYVPGQLKRLVSRYIMEILSWKIFAMFEAVDYAHCWYLQRITSLQHNGHIKLLSTSGSDRMDTSRDINNTCPYLTRAKNNFDAKTCFWGNGRSAKPKLCWGREEEHRIPFSITNCAFFSNPPVLPSSSHLVEGASRSLPPLSIQSLILHKPNAVHFWNDIPPLLEQLIDHSTLYTNKYSYLSHDL